MKRIPREIVDKTWRRIGSMSPSEAPALVHSMSEEQPAVLAYLLASGMDNFNEDEREILLYVGIVIWQIMRAGGCLEPVSEETLEAVEARNLAMLQYLESECDGDFDRAVQLIFENYNQIEVLKYAIEAVLEHEPDEEPLVREENRGLMVYFLKNVIDCLDEQSPSS